jgi:hypothetical protein
MYQFFSVYTRNFYYYYYKYSTLFTLCLHTSVVILNGRNADFDVSKMQYFHTIVLFAVPVFFSNRLISEIISLQKATDWDVKYCRGLNLKGTT